MTTRPGLLAGILPYPSDGRRTESTRVWDRSNRSLNLGSHSSIEHERAERRFAASSAAYLRYHACTWQVGSELGFRERGVVSARFRGAAHPVDTCARTCRTPHTPLA